MGEVILQTWNEDVPLIIRQMQPAQDGQNPPLQRNNPGDKTCWTMVKKEEVKLTIITDSSQFKTCWVQRRIIVSMSFTTLSSTFRLDSNDFQQTRVSAALSLEWPLLWPSVSGYCPVSACLDPLSVSLRMWRVLSLSASPCDCYVMDMQMFSETNLCCRLGGIKRKESLNVWAKMWYYDTSWAMWSTLIRFKGFLDVLVSTARTLGF